MITRQQACFLAAAAEIEAARARKLRGKQGAIEIHAAEMRAARILGACASKGLLERHLEMKVQAQLLRHSAPAGAADSADAPAFFKDTHS